MNRLVKQTWLDRAVEIHKFHIQQCRDNPNWTLEKTAKSLSRSIGSVSMDLKIASWTKTHEKQLKRCNSLRDALSWIKSKEREQMFD